MMQAARAGSASRGCDRMPSDSRARARAAAGTYTPLCLVGLAPPVRERLLATVWGGAALGMLQARPAD